MMANEIPSMPVASSFRVRLVNIRDKPKRLLLTNHDVGLTDFSMHGDILSMLGTYFEYFRQVKALDPDIYGLFSKVGGAIASDEKECLAISPRVLAQHFDLDRLPSAGCALLANRETLQKLSADNKCAPVFVSYMKYRTDVLVPGVEPPPKGAWLFGVQVYFDVDGNLYPVHCFISCNAAGETKILRQRTSKYVTVGKKNRCTFTRDEWGLPAMLKDWSKDNDNRDPEDIVSSVFAFIASCYVRDQDVIQVRATDKAGITAAFNVSMGRTPKFFVDREIEVNHNGRKRKIFHVVPGYQRDDGTVVRMHTKGLRRFSWNGYRIDIGVPGVDYVAPSSFKAAASVVDEEESRGWVTLDKIGDVMRDHVFSSALMLAKRRQRRSRR